MRNKGLLHDITVKPESTEEMVVVSKKFLEDLVREQDQVEHKLKLVEADRDHWHKASLSVQREQLQHCGLCGVTIASLSVSQQKNDV